MSDNGFVTRADLRGKSRRATMETTVTSGAKYRLQTLSAKQFDEYKAKAMEVFSLPKSERIAAAAAFESSAPSWILVRTLIDGDSARMYKDDETEAVAEEIDNVDASDLYDVATKFCRLEAKTDSTPEVEGMVKNLLGMDGDDSL